MIWNEIRKKINISDIIPINKGFSRDEKFLLITGTGEKYLARITKTNAQREFNVKLRQFELLRNLRNYSRLVPRAYDFGISGDDSSCYMILQYFEGEDGEESLGKMNKESQYAIGLQAGEELRNLHRLSAPPETLPWNIYKMQKYHRYCTEFLKNPLEPRGVDLGTVQMFINEHMNLLAGTANSFLHDDFHPANLIIHNNNLNGIIDFNRCEWGDPIHDFYKMAFFTRDISIPFARGQVDGYFNGVIPPGFWEKYSLYCAMSIIPDLVWSYRYDCHTGSDKELDKANVRIKTLYDDQDGFSSVIPRWYRKTSYQTG